MRTFIHTILLTILCLQGSMVVVCLVRFGGRCRSLDGSIYTCSSSYICNYDNCMCPEQISHYFDLNDQSCKPRDFVNIAKGKPTSMSAPKYVEHADSWRANDGNYGADVSQCAYPHIDVVPSWWKVNLLAYYEIHRVIIYSNYLGQHCRMTLIGGNYRGNVNITKSGKTCQAWSSVTPHKHHFNGTLADQENYCRNPDTEPEGPWCYTTDVNSRWEYCDVHYCVRPFREYAVEVLSGSKVFLCNDSSEARNVYLDSTCASNTIGREVRITTTGHTLLLCEVDINGTLVNLYKASCVTDIKPEECITPLNCSADGFCDCESPTTQFYNRNNNTCIDRNTYKENCSSMKEDTTCYNNLVCVTGICDCEIPAMQYHDPFDKSCKGKNTYKENCTTLVGDSTCYNNMVCVSDICDCEFPVMQYNDPYDKTCKAKSTYNETCSTLIGDSTCYNNMVCVSDICDCEIPAMQYHYPYDKSCKAIGTYRENCTTLIGDSTCYNNMVCVSDICDCEIPATQYHDPYDKSCKAIGTYRENCTTLIGDSTCYNNMVCVSGFCDCEIPSSQYHDPNDKSCKAKHNYALQRNAWQSSTYPLPDNQYYHPSKAVDGNEYTVSLTDFRKNSYWTVDLGKTVNVNQINIISRKDCCGHRLHTIEGTVGLNSNEMKHCSNFEGPSKTGQFIMLACKTPILGRYVTILKHAQGQLGLAEVQVLGHTVSTYNEDCSTTVGDASCYNNMVCVSGICDCEIPAMQYHDPSDKSCKAISTYNENCLALVGDSTCYNNMVCVSDICDCEIPATQYHDPYDKSCKAKSTYKENCTTLVGDSTCYNNMVCVSDICDCEIPAMQYHDPDDKSCKAISKYNEACSTLVGDSTCYNNMVCVSDICDCEIPAMQYHDPSDKSCKAISTYNENCSTPVGDASCYNNMVCISGICDCEIPATQYHYPYDKSCKAMSTYNENCTTLIGDSTCYNNMVCVSDICDCEIPAMQYHDPYAKSCEAIRTYKENCSTLVGDSTCYNNMVCLSGTCDCEIPALQYYVFYDKSCKTRAKYKEPCQTLEDGSNCYGNMICASGVCGCNTTQYYNPNVHSCNETGRYLDPCSTAVRNISCYPPLLCSSSVCHCELPAMMHYDADDNTCNDASFNAEEFVNDTKGFGNIVGATMDSIHHMHIEIEEKEHIIEEMVTVLAVLPTENEAAMENVLEASNQISKEADALSDNVQDSLLNVMDKISDQISHTDFNKSEPGRVENMVKSLFDSSSNLLDLNHVPERHTVKEKVIVEDKSETEDVIHVEETEPEQEVPYESPEEQQETQVQQTEAEIKAREKKIERTKKLLHTVDIIADSALKTLSDDEPKTMEFSTKTMNLVVGVSKLNNSTNTSTDISTSRKIGNKTVTSSFKLPPEIKEQLKEASKNGFKFQMLFSDKNPRSWDKSSAYINSPMISLILKDLNQKTLGVTKLPKPIIIDIPIGRNEKYSEFILNSKEDNFIRLKVKQPANMFYMLKLMTDGPQYNISVKIAIEFHKQVSLSDAENGTLISNTQIAFLKEPEKKSLYWSLGVIVNDRSNGNISQNISVRISSTAINCRYWNNTIGKWVPDGCQVSPVSSSETLECECDHLTDFAGGVFVLPHIVDPFQDALLFLTFFDNPVVVTVVILVWLIYFLGLYRARQADRKDSNFDGIVTPFPSDPSDPFKYLMCIVTGWRYDARTTANVSCYIKGNTGQSARHCLSRTSSPQVLFTSGGEDWFLITSSYDIGDMVNVIVWHDNSGSSPSWFLSRIIIQDLQTKKVFNFYYDNWLGIQSGTAKVCLSIKSGYELKQQFFLRTSQDLRRGHLWISIISKPPCSNFTRAQRLSCALSLLFCTMLSCLMFHGIPTDETISSDVASIQFEFSLKDFIIGLESSIIMFPINFAIIELFVRSKTKQLHKERYMEIGVNRPTTSDEKGSDKKDNEIVAVKRWMFPWWVIYIAWTTTILTSLVSSYFVMLYGLKYGYYESLNWLVSFLTAFFDDVFLMEPISVVFFAMLFTFILKREVKIDSAPALIVHKPEKNNTLLQKRSNTKTFIP
ncbi:uncharacterized protein [Mytilus edulis]|uniref:uncharacterized protein isoform X2 n=1 Tax=Mytilus edulis TaxID=6550 RepID=UPI0039EE1261